MAEVHWKAPGASWKCVQIALWEYDFIIKAKLDECSISMNCDSMGPTAL